MKLYYASIFCYQNLVNSLSFCKKQKILKIVKNLLIFKFQLPWAAPFCNFLKNFFDENTSFVLCFKNFTARGLNNSIFYLEAIGKSSKESSRQEILSFIYWTCGLWVVLHHSNVLAKKKMIIQIKVLLPNRVFFWLSQDEWETVSFEDLEWGLKKNVKNKSENWGNNINTGSFMKVWKFCLGF